MRRKRLADRDILTRKLYIFRWHLKHNGHIPEVKAEMERKIGGMKLGYFIVKDTLTVDENRKIHNPFLPDQK